MKYCKRKLGCVSKRLAIAVGLVCISSLSRADFFNGNEMHNSCLNSNRVFLNGFVAGVLDKSFRDRAAVLKFIERPNADVATASEFFGIAMNGVGWFCVPENVNVTQATDVFCKYLRNNPKERHKEAATLMVQAMEEAFPCTTKN